MEKTRYLILIVKNNAGVLARISSLFGQRGFNIDSLTVSATNKPGISRITVSTTGDEKTFVQIQKQTAKLQETLHVVTVESPAALLRELLLVKLSTDGNLSESIRALSERYGARIIDISNGSMVLELTGAPDRVDEFLRELEPFCVLEMCRTGVTALERGHTAYQY